MSDTVKYIGSGEHKRYPNPLADPALRTDASDCDAVDRTLSQQPELLQRVLEEVIERGQVDSVTEGGLPRYGWGLLEISAGRIEIFEVRLTNSTLGHYKGYFIGPADLVGKKAWVRRNLSAGGPWSVALK